MLFTILCLLGVLLFILQNLMLTHLLLKASRLPFLPKSETVCLGFNAAFSAVWPLCPSIFYYCADSLDLSLPSLLIQGLACVRFSWPKLNLFLRILWSTDVTITRAMLCGLGHAPFLSGLQSQHLYNEEAARISGLFWVSGTSQVCLPTLGVNKNLGGGLVLSASQTTCLSC